MTDQGTKDVPPILTPKEAAALCGCSVKTLYRAGVPYVQLRPHKRVFILENLLEYMRGRAA